MLKRRLSKQPMPVRWIPLNTLYRNVRNNIHNNIDEDTLCELVYIFNVSLHKTV